jgi:HD superfamily phosphohydrolase
MEVRDPIHGFIEYDSTEEKIINSGLFQRLRSIRQLALASFVYPGAHHTRFEHSIGTMHLAGKVARKLEFDDSKTRIVRLAALLHDIGHGPFSHVSEQILERYAANLMKQYQAENAHELMSILLIQKHPDIARILTGSDINDVVGLLQKQPSRSIEKDIISGPLDVDKLDYLLRDSHFAGVRYGVFDLDKVIESFTSVGIGSGGVTLGVNGEGVHAIEQLLLAKYHMNAQVYCHRIRRITDGMLVRGIEFALKDGLPELINHFAVTDSREFVENYAEYNDEALSNLILSKGKGSSLEYFKRIRERRLLKEVFCVNIDSRNFQDPVILYNIRQISDQQMQRITEEAAHLFSDGSNRVDSNMVIVDRQTISNPTFKSPGVKIDSNTIMVQTTSGREYFPGVSSVFHNPGIDPDVETLYLYLPLDWLENREGRKAYIKGREESIMQKIKEIVK